MTRVAAVAYRMAKVTREWAGRVAVSVPPITEPVVQHGRAQPRVVHRPAQIKATAVATAMAVPAR